MTRAFWLSLHRYAGLYLALHLTVIGAAGALIAFYSELDHYFARQLRVVEPHGERRDPIALAARAETLEPRGLVTDFALNAEPTESFMARMEPRVDPATNLSFPLGFTEIFVDPYTGADLGRRDFANLSQGTINLAPFIYRFHYSFMLGDIGAKLLGVAALIWTLNALIGFYLTLPPAAPADSGRRPLSRWLQAWRIEWRGGRVRLNYDLHRASGLWFWPMLALFAWSCVCFNLHDAVYAPVMNAVLGVRETQRADAPVPVNVRLDWRDALERGRALMAQEAANNHFAVEEETYLALDRSRGVYSYFVRSSRDIGYAGGSTILDFDADHGAFVALRLPSGASSVETFTSWLTALHTGRLFHPAYRLVIFCFGLAVVTLSITGVRIWRRKWRLSAKRVT